MHDVAHPQCYELLVDDDGLRPIGDMRIDQVLVSEFGRK